MDLMPVYCALDCETEVARYVRDLGCGAGQIVCLECYGTGVWYWGEPVIPAFPCTDCKGTGRQLVSIA
jgi:hypothetical protein